jgi:hypothetical protein
LPTMRVAMRGGSRFGSSALYSSPRTLLRSKDLNLDARNAKSHRVGYAGYLNQDAVAVAVLTIAPIGVMSGHMPDVLRSQPTKIEGQPAHAR